MKTTHPYSRLIGLVTLGFLTLSANANELNDISNSSLNYVLWFSVVAGIIVGFLVYKWLHRNFKSFETLKSWAVAVLVAVLIASLPLWFGEFQQNCLQQITDSSGQVREMVNGADQCVLSREGVSALGISSVIAGFKSAFGYNASGNFLSTGLVYFFYYAMVIFWTSVIYLLALLDWKKLKS